MVNFLLHFIPDMVFHLLVVFGILGVIFSFSFPIPNAYKTTLQAACVLALTFAVFFEGVLFNEKRWAIQVAEAEKRVAELMVESEKVNTQLVSQLAENDRLQLENKYATRTEIVKVEKIINKSCTIDPNVIRIHNAAVRGRK